MLRKIFFILIVGLLAPPVSAVKTPDFVRYYWSGNELNVYLVHPKYGKLNYQLKITPDITGMAGYLRTGLGISFKNIEVAGLVGGRVKISLPPSHFMDFDWQYFSPETTIRLAEKNKIIGQYFIPIKKGERRYSHSMLEFSRQSLSRFVKQVGIRTRFQSFRTYTLFCDLRLLPEKRKILQDASVDINYNSESGFGFSVYLRSVL